MILEVDAGRGCGGGWRAEVAVQIAWEKRIDEKVRGGKGGGRRTERDEEEEKFNTHKPQQAESRPHVPRRERGTANARMSNRNVPLRRMGTNGLPAPVQ